MGDSKKRKRTKRRKRSPIGKLLRFGLVLAAPGIINRIIETMTPAPENTLPGEAQCAAWDHGAVAYLKAGSGEPLLLVHGVSFGASNFEWRQNIEELAQHFTVYAVDLPGFGKSERKPIVYDADLYARFLVDFQRDVIGRPAHLVASSLGGAFAVKAAALAPERFTKLVLVEPTGLETLTGGPTLVRGIKHAALSIPLFGDTLYNLIGSRKSVRAYLENQVYWNRALVTEDLVEHYYRVGHQRGSRYAAQSFLSGMLNCDLKRVYPSIEQEILLLWGQHATVTPVKNANAFVQGNPRASLHVFMHSGLLPHDEEPSEFNRIVTQFLATSRLPGGSAQEVLTADVQS